MLNSNRHCTTIFDLFTETTSKPDEAASPGSSQPQTEEKTKEQGLTKTQAPTLEPASTHPQAHPSSTEDKAQSATTDQVAQSNAEKPKPDDVDQSAECIKQEEASGSWDMTGTVVCDSDMDSDIEGMEVIGEDGVHMDDSMEEEDVCLEDMEQQDRLEDETKSSPSETETAVAPEEKGSQAKEEEVKGEKEEVMERAEMETVPSVELSTAALSGQEPEPKKDEDDLIAATTMDEEEVKLVLFN